MAKKKVKKSELEKVLGKVKKQVEKLEALHEKEDDIVSSINETVEEALDEGNWGTESY